MAGFGIRPLATLVLAACLGAGAACAPVPQDQDPEPSVNGTRQPGPTATPAERSVALVTRGCGVASAGIGSGVLLDAGWIVTAAHVVAGAAEVRAVLDSELPSERSWPTFSAPGLFPSGVPAEVVLVDRQRDLALLAADAATDDLARPEVSTARVGEAVEIMGVVAPEPTVASVAEVTTIVADEVRGTGRVRRSGYVLGASTVGGDSGAGVWSMDGELVGLVFAVSTESKERTFAVDGSEIEALLADAGDPSRAPNGYRCNPDSSRLEPVTG